MNPTIPIPSIRSVINLTFFIFSIGIVAFGAKVPQAQTPAGQEVGLLRLLGITPSAESIDYVQNKTQFQLHTLLTEQRHPKTWNLSERVQQDAADGLRMLLSVDEDISARLKTLAADGAALETLVTAVEQAILAKRTIYIYGCGATGRLAKQMESAFWRPFWRGIMADESLWKKIRPLVAPAVDEELIGEMTGGDRALISSLEGFEDLQLIGRLQLGDRRVRRGDVVICVTEGGETSSVIGTVLAALEEWKSDGLYDPAETRRRLFFVYNNPDDRLLPFVRSRAVIEEPGITKINLTTGPQAITGSTRMQATTIETFVIAGALETAVERVLGRALSKKEMARSGFGAPLPVESRLDAFPSILDEVRRSIPALARLTTIEAETYAAGHFSTYFAERAVITVFIDSTERSPTFRLFPLDTTAEPRRRCWIQVWTPAADARSAWLALLGRPFRGLAPDIYRAPFETGIEDPYLRAAALESLKKAGDDQQSLYDFSFAENNVKNRGPQKDDLGVAVLAGSEIEQAAKPGSAPRRFAELFRQNGARVAVIAAGEEIDPGSMSQVAGEGAPVIQLKLSTAGDPFGIRQQVGLKMLLNAHSTAVMARLGKVIGNTMTNVSPSNLKLIGRATFLIQSHVNDVLAGPAWVKERGYRPPIAYGEANAVLFDAIAFLKDKKDTAGQTAEVALSIIRILESLRQGRGLTNEEALAIVQSTGLAAYLAGVARSAS
jgi:N-acetylmuramic acid 6-phosphate (MurNAc-6-P) etherase